MAHPSAEAGARHCRHAANSRATRQVLDTTADQHVDCMHYYEKERFDELTSTKVCDLADPHSTCRRGPHATTPTCLTQIESSPHQHHWRRMATTRTRNRHPHTRLPAAPTPCDPVACGSDLACG